MQKRPHAKSAKAAKKGASLMFSPLGRRCAPDNLIRSPSVSFLGDLRGLGVQPNGAKTISLRHSSFIIRHLPPTHGQ